MSFILQDVVPSDLFHVGCLWEVTIVTSSSVGTEFIDELQDLSLVGLVDCMSFAMVIMTNMVWRIWGMVSSCSRVSMWVWSWMGVVVSSVDNKEKAKQCQNSSFH